MSDTMTTTTEATTTAPAGPASIDPAATYTDRDVARAFNITDRQLRRWRKDRSMRFPRPFHRGRTPCWRGHVLIAWEERQQAEAQA